MLQFDNQYDTWLQQGLDDRYDPEVSQPTQTGLNNEELESARYYMRGVIDSIYKNGHDNEKIDLEYCLEMVSDYLGVDIPKKKPHKFEDCDLEMENIQNILAYRFHKGNVEHVYCTHTPVGDIMYYKSLQCRLEGSGVNISQVTRFCYSDFFKKKYAQVLPSKAKQYGLI